jgi:murein L,D-transpeptidase YafK
MRAILLVLSLIGLVALASCSKFKTYDGPEVTRVLVYKGSRTMYLMHHTTVLAAYTMDLGFAPEGHKQRSRDGKTPEGSYFIDRKNPDSEYHLSLGISYPDKNDRLVATEAGDDPGGDIFIHGGPTEARDRNKRDWTAGCIAVTDKEIEDIYAMVRVGTPIEIYP